MNAATQWGWQSAWPAPAKLNLFLHVVGRRADGYHLLQTVFCFIDRADTLHFAPRADGQVRLLTPLPGVPADSDLTVRAARLLQQESGCRQGVDIRLDKHLPMGGGLGGGSSDAATVLLALNHLWQLHLPRQRLQEIGLSLGADVPIFIYGRTAFAEGVGEEFQPVATPPAWYVVIEPGVEVPTAAIFSAPELKRDSAPTTVAAWQSDFGGNDLQDVACQRFPAVAAALAKLAALNNASAPRMTGSGACVFAAFASRKAAEEALQQLPAGTIAWLAAGLERHPLTDLGQDF